MVTGQGVWAFCEGEKAELTRASLEVTCEGRKLADRLGEELCSVILGENVGHLARVPPHYGADKVYLVEHERLSSHNMDSRITAATNLIKETVPRIVLFPASALGREMAPRLAARLKVGLVTECIELKVNEEKALTTKRLIFGGKACATLVHSPPTPQMATVVPGALDIKKPNEKREGQVVRVAPTMDDQPPRVEFITFVKGDPKTISLPEAEIIISVGKGLGKKENFHVVEELAEVLGASIGGSRAAVDAGLVPTERQIGLTGKTVTPRLYIACGISGQHNHTVGIEGSPIIIAINTDRHAPIFELADLGILGDLNEVVPSVARRIKESIALQEKRYQ